MEGDVQQVVILLLNVVFARGEIEIKDDGQFLESFTARVQHSNFEYRERLSG